MTNKEMRIEIAKALGWKNCRNEEGGNMPSGEPDDDFNRDVELHKTHGYCGFPTTPHREDLPNYPGDLNACREMEESLTDDEYLEFALELARIRNNVCSPLACRCYSAKAPERCQAFLKVKGLLKEAAK